ncbi:MAG: hypothetical protein WCG32_04435 [Actinomycetes bacterium]
MKITTGQSCLAMVFILALIVSVQNFQNAPYFLILIVALIITSTVALVYNNNAKSKKLLEQLEHQATILDELVKNDFKIEDVMFSTQKEETVIYHLEEVILTEFKSTGSSYSGGYGGVSFRVAKGVRLNTGKTGGTSKRDPETSQPIDSGELTVTNQRVVFSGANQVRVFDLDKVVNMEAGDNGITVSISVSNRERTSGLASTNMDDLTPGMAVSLATAWHDGGKKETIKVAQDLAAQLRTAIATERSKAK